jgi:hypothetical protein
MSKRKNRSLFSGLVVFAALIIILIITHFIAYVFLSIAIALISYRAGQKNMIARARKHINIASKIDVNSQYGKLDRVSPYPPEINVAMRTKLIKDGFSGARRLFGDNDD